ncbi:MAG TPA: zinc-binding alcohol dehydrogenase, partial [Terriglobales bacterium]|nr:zinc-binding alcohol dehydrogenase [Terriglobales bacterium]
MKQLVHNLATGEGQVWDVPAPQPGPNDIVVRNRASVISAGTERTVIEFSQQTLLGKALSRPDLAREALAKAKRDGVLATLDSIRNRLNEPAALGYSSAGEVIATGSDVTEFRIGNRVACAGGGYAVHAEAVRIPRTMAALLPASGHLALSFEEAAFAAIGSVALHALRLASVQVGEAVAIIGLGLIGQLAVQLASAAGCRVVGIDPDVSRCDLARGLGCERVASTPELFESMVNELTRGLGADVVLIAAASAGSEALEVAARVARDRACVVSVGATGMELPRKAFYEKEIDFKI